MVQLVDEAYRLLQCGKPLPSVCRFVGVEDEHGLRQFLSQAYTDDQIVHLIYNRDVIPDFADLPLEVREFRSKLSLEQANEMIANLEATIVELNAIKYDIV